MSPARSARFMDTSTLKPAILRNASLREKSPDRMRRGKSRGDSIVQSSRFQGSKLANQEVSVMRMLVIGVGPIGGIIGGRLARAANDITFVDIDEEHVAAIRQKGLQVDVPDGPFTVNIKIVFPSEIEGKYDLGLIAVRSNYTSDALHAAMPHLTD